MITRDEEADRIIAEHRARGKIVEGGWQGMRETSLPNTTMTEEGLRMLQAMFFAGASYLFGIIIDHMTRPERSVEDDTDFLATIKAEIELFLEEKARK